jgi:hypothetical protein
MRAAPGGGRPRSAATPQTMKRGLSLPSAKRAGKLVTTNMGMTNVPMPISDRLKVAMN